MKRNRSKIHAKSFEQFEDHGFNKKHKGVKKSSAGMEFKNIAKTIHSLKYLENQTNYQMEK